MNRTVIVRAVWVVGVALAVCANFAIAQTPIGFGNSVFDSIDCGQTGRYSFVGREGDRVVIFVTQCSDFGGVCQSACFCFDQCVTLTTESGSVVARNCSPLGNNSGRAFRTEIGEDRLPADGTYTLAVVDGDKDGRGSYTVFLQRTNEPGRSEVLVNGDEQVVALNTCGEVDSYTFSAIVGDTVQINMARGEVGSIVPRLELYDPGGRAVALPSGGTINQRARTTGDFTLLAFSAVRETGTYFIRLNILPQETTRCAPLLVNPTGSAPGVVIQDMDGDGDYNPITECIRLLRWQFLGETPPVSPCFALSGLPDTGQKECYDPGLFINGWKLREAKGRFRRLHE